jgi:hypothetical protein
LKQTIDHRVTARLAGLLLVGAAFVSQVAMAEPDDLAKLAASPTDYLDKQVEIAGYCVKGGVKGDVLGYECTTEGGIYVDTDEIEPASAKEKLDASCNGEKQDAACRATIRFVPHSFTTSNVLEPDKTITIFNTKKAELSF